MKNNFNNYSNQSNHRHFNNYTNQQNNNQNNNHGYYNNMYEPNNLGKQFQRKKKNPILKIIAIVMVLILLGVSSWYLFFKKDIDDFEIGEQVYLAFENKLEEVFESGSMAEQDFANEYLMVLETLMLDNSDENGYESINDSMMTSEMILLDLQNQIKSETNDETLSNLKITYQAHKYTTHIQVKDNRKSISLLQKEIVDKMNRSNEVQKNTADLLKKSLIEYDKYLAKFEKYLDNPTTDNYEDSKKTHNRAVNYFSNSIVEYIR